MCWLRELFLFYFIKNKLNCPLPDAWMLLQERLIKLYMGFVILYDLFKYGLHFPVMASAAPEGSQFDARQYDDKMNE